MPCSAHMGNLIAEHEDFLSRQNIRIATDIKQLPSFYWLPKMHKNPIGSRFIAASSARTTKLLSQLLTSSLKLTIILDNIAKGLLEIQASIAFKLLLMLWKS